MVRILSNIASKSEIEKNLGISFRFPNLYVPNPIIYGENESNLPLITSEKPNEIVYGIWGLLPQDFQDEWKDFQRIFESFTVPLQRISLLPFYHQPFLKRRCLVVVTGYLVTMINKSTLNPYLAYREHRKPFYIAGVYNVLEDGFLTFSILTDHASNQFDKIGIDNFEMPLVITDFQKDTWLNQYTSNEELVELLQLSKKTEIKIRPVSKEIFQANYMHITNETFFKNR